ncbi:MAG: hypothetical protein JNL79_30030 [Myxococcales bacterium]|nr:hypothetical protein [Myxococcales bacterium]
MRPGRSASSLESSARAKLALGEDPNDVYRFLDLEGASPELAQEIVHKVLAEQAAHVRYEGRVHALSGGAALAIGLWLLDVYGPHFQRGLGTFLVGLALGGVGAYYLVTGALKAIRGRSGLS